ncbi:hypothetical protein T484DRAFT_1845782 [Baffinella frigidus]|nr:hypothetical protein T484DRAFT_1845782 [Cryptophyta sp. CCMP2293]
MAGGNASGLSRLSLIPSDADCFSTLLNPPVPGVVPGGGSGEMEVVEGDVGDAGGVKGMHAGTYQDELVSITVNGVTPAAGTTDELVSITVNGVTPAAGLRVSLPVSSGNVLTYQTDAGIAANSYLSLVDAGEECAGHGDKRSRVHSSYYPLVITSSGSLGREFTADSSELAAAVFAAAATSGPRLERVCLSRWDSSGTTDVTASTGISLVVHVCLSRGDSSGTTNVTISTGISLRLQNLLLGFEHLHWLADYS